MKICVTGAFGSIGYEIIKKGFENKHEMSAFDIDTKNNRIKADELKSYLSHVFYGDLRDKESLISAFAQQDVIIHLAGIITPMSEQNVQVSDSVNIGGTQNIIEVLENYYPNKSLIFTSSMSIMGKDAYRTPPLKISDPVFISSNYTRQKIECEKMLNQSQLSFIIFRLAAVINTDFRVSAGSLDKLLDEVFSMSLNNRIEGIWNIDVATALIYASERMQIDESIKHQTYFIAGGKNMAWQMSVKEFYTSIFKAIGFGLPYESAFSLEPYYADWLDTEESQKLFNYQNHHFEEFLNEVKTKMGIKRYLFIILSPFIRFMMSMMSKNKH